MRWPDHSCLDATPNQRLLFSGIVISFRGQCLAYWKGHNRPETDARKSFRFRAIADIERPTGPHNYPHALPKM